MSGAGGPLRSWRQISDEEWASHEWHDVTTTSDDRQMFIRGLGLGAVLSIEAARAVKWAQRRPVIGEDR